jgi:transmembrane sensor
MTDLAHINTLSAGDAAALWLVKRDQGLDVAADAGFTAWLDVSPANRQAWIKAQALWDDFDGPEDVLIATLRQAALAARPERKPPWVWAAAAAAAVAVMVAGGIGWKATMVKPAAPSQAAGLIAANAKPDDATEIGVQTAVTLPDGTEVMLDTNSALAVRYSPGHRVVRLLRGQAYFTVVHDAANPFVVAAGDRTVTDTGTEFAVTTAGNGLSVTLAKGSVVVGGKGEPRMLKPGQQLLGTEGRDDAVSSVDLDQVLAWRTGFLEFRDEPLGQAVAEMNRYGVPVIVPDPATAALRISGRFRAGDPTRFAQALAEIYPVRLTKGPGGAEIDAAR